MSGASQRDPVTCLCVACGRGRDQVTSVPERRNRARRMAPFARGRGKPGQRDQNRTRRDPARPAAASRRERSLVPANSRTSTEKRSLTAARRAVATHWPTMRSWKRSTKRWSPSSPSSSGTERPESSSSESEIWRSRSPPKSHRSSRGLRGRRAGHCRGWRGAGGLGRPHHPGWDVREDPVCAHRGLQSHFGVDPGTANTGEPSE
jgi:hypothetical protein